MLTEQSFTDPQGTVIESAVVRVFHARRYHTWDGFESDTLDLNLADMTDGLIEANSSNSNDNENIQVQYVYWTTQAAYDAGSQPYTLSTSDTGTINTTFTIPKTFINDEAYAESTLEEICDGYFTSTILPTLTAS